MAKRKILLKDVRHVIDTGEIIEQYREDKPLASRLILGSCGGRPIHVVAANHPDSPDDTHIITVYEPNRKRWDAAFKKRVRRKL